MSPPAELPLAESVDALLALERDAAAAHLLHEMLARVDRSQQVATLDLLALVHRRNGDLSRAVATLELAAILDDALGGAEPRAVQPCPVLNVAAFASPGEVEVLRADVAGLAADFQTARVGSEKRVDDGRRRALMLEKQQLPATARALGARVHEGARALAQRLGLAIDDPERVEYRLVWSGDGDYFRRHRDDVSRGETSRWCSFVLGLSPQHVYEGGHLRLYDPADGEGGPLRLDHYTQLAPRAGDLAVFRSGTWHEVTPVATTSADPAGGRLVLSGHIWATSRDEPTDGDWLDSWWTFGSLRHDRATATMPSTW